MEQDATGIITKTSKDSCVVSFNNDGTTAVLSFGPSIFYSFGVRCEGDMTNIMEEETEVNLCYRNSPAGYPCLVAVWLGEKPESFSDADTAEVSGEDTAATVYDKVGQVVAMTTDTFIVKSDDRQVIVSRDVAFRDGGRFDVETTLEMDEEVWYDAIRCEGGTSEVSHRATCAWIGIPPGLVLRFSLKVGTDERNIEAMTRHEICGVVAVIPSEVIAFVEVKFESCFYRVMLFRSSFKPACERIQEKVAVGDTLCMKLGSRSIFGGHRQLIAAKVVVEKDERSDEPLVEFKETVKADSSLKSAPSFENVSNCVDLSNVDDTLVVLYSDPPLRGIISQYSCDSACISYGFLKVFTDRDNFYLDGQKSSVADFMSIVAPGSKAVNFEAVPTTMSGFSHEATCVWVGEKPGFRAVLSSLASPNFDLLKEKERAFYGVISKLCLPELAFVNIPSESTTACVHVSQCVDTSWYTTLENFRDDIGLISSYVALKDCVQFKVERLEGILFAREVSLVRSVNRVFSEEATYRAPVKRPKNAYEVLASIVVKAREAGLNSGKKKKAIQKQTSYNKVAAKTVAKLAAGEIPVAKASVVSRGFAENANIKRTGGKSASNQNVSKAAKRVRGKKAKKNTVAQNNSSQTGCVASIQNAPGKKATKGAAKKNAVTQNNPNQTGNVASIQNAPGEKATKGAAKKNAATQNNPSQTGNKTSTQSASGKKRCS